MTQRSRPIGANFVPARTLVALGLSLAVLLPHAQAGRGAYTYLSVQHTALERQGDAFTRHAWDVVELSDPIKSELTGYQSFIDGKLTMDHQARAEAWVVSGIDLGDPGQGPRLKVETDDSLQFNGTPIQSLNGAVWERSESVQRAEAFVTTDLGFVAGSPQPHTLMFYWLLDGQVDYAIRAPQSLVPGGGQTNPLSVNAPTLQSIVRFSAYQDDCVACGTFSDSFVFGGTSVEVYAQDPYYTYHAELPPTIVFVPFIVSDAPGFQFTNLTFFLDVEAWHDLTNGDYQNVVLDGRMQSRFGNSASLLGVLPLDADGRVVSGVQLTSSDPDLFFPVLSEVPAVPEPSTWLMWLSGLIAICHWASRRGRVGHLS